MEQTIIRAHLWTEHFLIQLIEGGVARPASLDMDRMSFATKVQIASALGLMPRQPCEVAHDPQRAQE